MARRDTEVTPPAGIEPPMRTVLLPLALVLCLWLAVNLPPDEPGREYLITE